MKIRTRLTVTSAVLLVGAVTSACGGGGGGAPADASTEDFCEAQTSLLSDLDIDFTNPEASLPDEEAMADAMHSWAERIEEVGTPEGISDEARKGFEITVDAASGISADDLESPDLDALEADMSDDDKASAEAFSTYVTEECGSMLGDIEMPEMPELPETSETP